LPENRKNSTKVGELFLLIPYVRV